MNPLENILPEEKETLQKFPVYVSLLATASDHTLDVAEKKSAIQFSRIKTYSSDPLLNSFYQEADHIFKQNLLQLDDDLSENQEERTEAIKMKSQRVEKIVLKLGNGYTSVMHLSMKSFKEHVSKSHHNVLEDFIFPIPIKALAINLK